ncbi:MAG: hypothetical protein Q8891_10865 [Bacteroidota bacterium]|nr:hypothetical protein [Bacteroidota bacterium]
MRKVSINFGRYSDPNFGKKSDLIYNSMNGNEAYPTPVPSLEVLQAQNTQYNIDLLAAATRDRDAVANKNRSRQELDTTLRLLALYVMQEAQGDEATLISSGFTLTKQREPAYITSPGVVTLASSLSVGEMEASLKSVPASVCYMFQFTTEPPAENTVWESHNSSASKYVFRNLTQGQQYWVRVGVIGRKGQLAYSPVSSMYVQ